LENSQEAITPIVKRVLTGNNTSLVGSPLISVKEARKLLGASAKTLTNEEVKMMVRDYTPLVRYVVRNYLVRK
jgi:hypothetical protein